MARGTTVRIATESFLMFRKSAHSSDSNGNLRAVYWHHGIPIDLNTQVAASNPYLLWAADINDHAEIAGWRVDSTTGRRNPRSPTRNLISQMALRFINELPLPRFRTDLTPNLAHQKVKFTLVTTPA